MHSTPPARTKVVVRYIILHIAYIEDRSRIEADRGSRIEAGRSRLEATIDDMVDDRRRLLLITLF